MDIRTMSKAQIDGLNAASAARKQMKLMPNKTNKSTTTATEKKPRTINTTPAVTSVRPITAEQVNAAAEQSAFRSQFTKDLNAIEPGLGIEVEGDIKRIKMSVYLFNKRSKRGLQTYKGENGTLIIARPASVPTTTEA
jgi:hypothetical protein